MKKSKKNTKMSLVKQFEFFNQTENIEFVLRSRIRERRHFFNNPVILDAVNEYLDNINRLDRKYHYVLKRDRILYNNYSSYEKNKYNGLVLSDQFSDEARISELFRCKLIICMTNTECSCDIGIAINENFVGNVDFSTAGKSVLFQQDFNYDITINNNGSIEIITAQVFAISKRSDPYVIINFRNDNRNYAITKSDVAKYESILSICFDSDESQISIYDEIRTERIDGVEKSMVKYEDFEIIYQILTERIISEELLFSAGDVIGKFALDLTRIRVSNEPNEPNFLQLNQEITIFETTTQADAFRLFSRFLPYDYLPFRIIFATGTTQYLDDDDNEINRITLYPVAMFISDYNNLVFMRSLIKTDFEPIKPDLTPNFNDNVINVGMIEMSCLRKNFQILSEINFPEGYFDEEHYIDVTSDSESDEINPIKNIVVTDEYSNTDTFNAGCEICVHEAEIEQIYDRFIEADQLLSGKFFKPDDRTMIHTGNICYDLNSRTFVSDDNIDNILKRINQIDLIERVKNLIRERNLPIIGPLIRQEDFEFGSIQIEMSFTSVSGCMRLPKVF